MKKVRQIGLDFGTSNTGICLEYEDGSIETISSDSTIHREKTFPTEIFFLNRDEYYVGTEARSMAQKNPDSGRHLRWLKKVLPMRIGMVRIFTNQFKISDLVAIILSHAKREIEKTYDVDWQTIKIKVGYPVVLGENEVESELAKSRLIEALDKSNFINYELIPEPVAVAHYYADEIKESSNVLIFDCGAGTTDLSYVNYKEDKSFDILGTSGVMKAGNNFDKALFIKRICPHLGLNMKYSFMQREEVSIPDTLYEKLSDSTNVFLLQSYKYRKHVERAISISGKPEYKNMAYAINQLKTVYLLGKAEEMKIDLSSKDFVNQEISLASSFIAESTYQDFLEATTFLRDDLVKLLSQFMADKPDPDLIIMTGGMSKHRIIQELVRKQFFNVNPEKILTRSTDAIVLGLANYK